MMELVTGALLAATVIVACSGLHRSQSEVVANVSLLLAEHYNVDCVQIFRSNSLPFDKVEAIFETWKNLAVLRAKLTTGVYTYERYLERKKRKPRKVSCYRSLKIASDDEDSRKGYEDLTQELAIKDAVWVLFLNSFSVNFFQYANIMFDDVIIIAVVKAMDLVLFHEVYKIASTFPLKVTPFGNWTKMGGLALLQKSVYDRRSDLEGVVLRTGLTENWPAAYVKNGKWEGFLVKVWNEIQRLINCSSVSVRAEDNLIGMRLENGSWNGLVGMALRGEIDVLISEIVINKERSHVLKFLYPMVKSRFQIYTRHLGYQWQWTSILKPFHVSVWVATLVWVLVISAFLTVSYNLCLWYGLEAPLLEKPFTPLKSFLFALQALCQQGYHMVPNSYTCRILFFMSYAVSGVLIPSYSASLVSSLAQKTHYRSFDSLQEMVADGSYRLIVKENSAQHAFLYHTKDSFLKEAYDKLARPIPLHQRTMGLTKSLQNLCQFPKYALMGIEEMVDVRMARRIQLSCTIVPLSNPVTTIHMTMATSRYNPFYGLINHHLQRLLVNGLVARLRLLEFPQLSQVKTHKDRDVGLIQVISPFAFIGVFTLGSVFLLLLEIQYHVYTVARNKRKRKKHHFRHDKGNKMSEYDLAVYKKMRS